jgi:hypothetical protein
LYSFRGDKALVIEEAVMHLKKLTVDQKDLVKYLGVVELL